MPQQGPLARWNFAAVAGLLIALASLLLGSLAVALLGLGGLGAIAVLLGWLAIRFLNIHEGPSFGRRLAAAGIVLGTVGIVITVLGFLATLLQSSWEASRRAECLNHLRVLGEATNRYYDFSAGRPGAKRHYPQAAVPNPELPPEHRLSWLVEVLPHLFGSGTQTQVRSLPATLDGIARQEAWDAPANRAAAESNVPLFLCPSSPHYDPRGHPGQSHYVGISGIEPRSAFLPPSHTRAGILGFDRLVARDDVTAGPSHVLLATETVQHIGCWLAAGEPTLRGVEPHENRYIGSDGRPFGGCHQSASALGRRRAGGANAVFLDGSATFLNEAISPRVFRGMATLAGLEGLEGTGE